MINQASASSGNPTLSYIKGNYNGIIVRTKTSPIYFLALPSIITSATGTLSHTGISGKILVHGETNSGGISYDTTVANFLVYSSGALPSTDAERILLGSGIARAYSGTSLASKVVIKPFVDALATNNTGSLESLGGGVVTSVGGSVASGGQSGGSGGGGTTPTTPAVCGTANGSTGSTAPSTSPTSNVCSVGTLSGTVTWAGPWNWTCNSTDGGSSASCTQYSNLVNGACTGLPANAVYYGGATSYSLVNASAGTSLVASGYYSTPTTNTCQYSCAWLMIDGTNCLTKIVTSTSTNFNDLLTPWNAASNGTIFYFKLGNIVWGLTKAWTAPDLSQGYVTNWFNLWIRYSGNWGVSFNNYTLYDQNGTSYGGGGAAFRSGWWYITYGNGCGNGGNIRMMGNGTLCDIAGSNVWTNWEVYK